MRQGTESDRGRRRRGFWSRGCRGRGRTEPKVAELAASDHGLQERWEHARPVVWASSHGPWNGGLGQARAIEWHQDRVETSWARVSSVTVVIVNLEIHRSQRLDGPARFDRGNVDEH